MILQHQQQFIFLRINCTKVTFIDVLSSLVTARNHSCCPFRASSYIVYGILSLNINVLPNRYFMNSFLIYLIELPSNMASAVAVHYIGRRSTSFISYFICIVSSIFAILLVERKSNITI